jgi:hypothetical protein
VSSEAALPTFSLVDKLLVAFAGGLQTGIDMIVLAVEAHSVKVDAPICLVAIPVLDDTLEAGQR